MGESGSVGFGEGSVESGEEDEGTEGGVFKMTRAIGMGRTGLG